jgi:hypothetical protein
MRKRVQSVVQAKGKPGDRQALSCVPLVLLLCSSCASPRSPEGFWRDCGGFTEPARGFDSTAGSIIQMKSHFRCKGSVTAGECLGGVRPSSGAAMLESNGEAMKPGALGYLVLAAPEEGRSPPTSPSPAAGRDARKSGTLCIMECILSAAGVEC